jgi:hypothetical protein
MRPSSLPRACETESAMMMIMMVIMMMMITAMMTRTA